MLTKAVEHLAHEFDIWDITPFEVSTMEDRIAAGGISPEEAAEMCAEDREF